MKHELQTLQVVCPERDYGNVCPACPVAGDKLSSHSKLIWPGLFYNKVYIVVYS